MVEVNIRMQWAVKKEKKKKVSWGENPIWGLCSLENEGLNFKLLGLLLLLLLLFCVFLIKFVWQQK